MAWMTGANSQAVGRLLEALGIAHRGVRKIDIRIRVDEAVSIRVVMDRIMDEEELDAITDFLPLTNPVVEVVDTEGNKIESETA